MPSASPEPRCPPGDIFITPTLSGFLLGRAIPQIGLGPWWTLIKVVAEFDDAVEQARALALADGVRAWVQTHVNEYDAVSEKAPMTR